MSTTTTTRQARCICGALRPSTELIGDGFFTDLSPEAEAARPLKNRSCGADRCGYNEGVHHEVNVFTGRPGITDHAYVPRVYEYDSWYCGCRGWD